MSNEVIDTPAISETVATEIPVEIIPTALVEQRYEWQPTDDAGRPIGAKQVVLYATQEDLAAKFAERNTLLIRKLREETRKNKLGISEPEELGERPRYQEPVTFEPRPTTPEERFKITRDLADAENFESARDAFIESAFGVKPEVIRRTLTELQEARLNEEAIAEANAFMRANPDYIVCPENSDAITRWIRRKNLAPIASNFQLAYDTLLAANVLIVNQSAAVDEETVPPSIVAPEPISIAPEPTPAPEPVPPPVPEFQPAGIPSGLTRETAADTGSVTVDTGDDVVYETIVNGQKRRFTGLAAIQAMPSDEYKRRIRDPKFVKREEQLERDAVERRKTRR